jgi:hypothetical protein
VDGPFSTRADLLRDHARQRRVDGVLADGSGERLSDLAADTGGTGDPGFEQVPGVQRRGCAGEEPPGLFARRRRAEETELRVPFDGTSEAAAREIVILDQDHAVLGHETSEPFRPPRRRGARHPRFV